MSVYLKLVEQYGDPSPLLPPPIINLNLTDDTIISYDLDGEVASRFSENQWYICNHCFKFDSDRFPASILRELKTLTYARIYWSPLVRSISSIRFRPLSALGNWAVLNKLSVCQVLNDYRLYSWLASSLSSLERREAEAIAALVSELSKIRIVNSNLTIAPGNFKLAELLREVAASIPKERIKQTAVIPTRLYANLITGFEGFLQEFNFHAQGIKQFYEFVVAGLESGGVTHRSAMAFKLWYKKPQNYTEIVSDYGLSELVEKYSLRDKKRWNQYIRNVQNTAKFWIHLFTGMRDEEVNTLNRECLSSLNIKGAQAKIVQGYTTKTIGSGASYTYWITSDIVDIGIDAALAIGEIAAIQNKWTLHASDYPLFPILFPMEACGGASFHANAPYSSGLSGVSRINEWLSLFPCLAVSESDLAELYAFDGFRDWSNEIIVGAAWPLATHQCRRSLAVYLARSGLVSIGSLQLQFKHLLTAMTSYYRRNSTFAKNFIFNDLDDEYHQAQVQLIDAIETERRVAQFLSFEEKVVENQAKLWGGEGTRIRRALEAGRPIVILADRQNLKKSFIEGDMHFREGPMGGCVNVGACNNLSVTKIGAPCISCANFIGDDESIASAEMALKTLYKTRDRYSKSSLHYLQAQSDIDDFEAKLRKAREATIERPN